MPSLIFYIKILVAIAVIVWTVGLIRFVQKRVNRKRAEQWFKNKIAQQ